MMLIRCFKKITPFKTILLTFSVIIFSSTGFFSFENSFAHDFSPDETANFLTLVDKIKGESELAVNSTNNNNKNSALLHANNAILNYDSHTQDEISERNERIANELKDTLNRLLVQVKSQTEQSQINGTVETISAILEEAISARIDEEQLNNSTIQALAFASIVDSALQNYGDAYNVGIDLTNMSNMMIHTTTTTTNDNTTTNGDTNHDSNNNISIHSNIVNFTNYESSLGFSNYALKKFYNEILLIPSITENNTTTINQNYLEKLDSGLVEFNTAIKNKEDPMKVMEIVHTKIHPNLQILFNLKTN